jgi:hypothetical protein
MHKIIPDPDSARRTQDMAYAFMKQSDRMFSLIKELQTPPEENCTALLVSSILLFIWEFVVRQLPDKLAVLSYSSLNTSKGLTSTERRPVLL